MACCPERPVEMVRAAASSNTGRCAGACLATVRVAAVVRAAVIFTDLVEHGFAACVRAVGAPCASWSHMPTAPNDTIEAVASPITGVKASRLVIDSLLPPSRESPWTS